MDLTQHKTFWLVLNQNQIRQLQRSLLKSIEMQVVQNTAFHVCTISFLPLVGTICLWDQVWILCEFPPLPLVFFLFASWLPEFSPSISEFAAAIPSDCSDTIIMVALQLPSCEIQPVILRGSCTVWGIWVGLFFPCSFPFIIKDFIFFFNFPLLLLKTLCYPGSSFKL